MPITVEVPDVGEVEFPDEMQPDEIKSVLTKRFGGKQEPPGQLEDLGKQAKGEFLQGVGTAIQGASEAMTPPRVAKVPPDVGGFEDEDALPGRPSFASMSPYPPPELAEDARSLARGAHLGSRPVTVPELREYGMHQVGQLMEDVGKQAGPPQTVGGRIGGALGGLASIAPTMAAAPLTMAMQAHARTLSDQYEKGKAAGLSDEAATTSAIESARNAGLAEGVIWSVLPTPLKSVLNKFTGKIGGSAVADFVQRRLVNSGEMTALSAASRAAQNVATDLPVTQGLGAAAGGGAIFGAFTPGEVWEWVKKAAKVLPIAAREAAKEPTSNNQQPTESETPNAGELIFDSSEHKANWEAVQKAEADYESTQPHTPERAAARKLLNEAKDKRGAQKPPINPKDPLRAVNAYATSDLSIGGQQDLTGAAWDGKADANGVRRIRLKDGGYVWLKESDAHPLIKEALDKNTKSTKEVSNASSEQKAGEVHAPVPVQPEQGARQVPAEEGGGGVQPSAQGEKGEVLLSPIQREIQKISSMTTEDFNNQVKNAKGDTMNNAHRIGKQVETPAEVDALKQAEASGKIEAAALKKKGDFQGAIQAQNKAQFFREAREYATETGSVQRLMSGNPDYKPKASEAKAAEKTTGWSRSPEVSYGGMKSEGLTEDQKAQLEPTWELTDKRKGSPTEGTTVYVPEGSDAATIQKAISEKSKAVEAAKPAQKLSPVAEPVAPIVDQPVKNPKADAAEAKANEAKQQQQLIPAGPGAATRPGATLSTDIGSLESNIPPLEQLAQVVKSFPKQKGSFKADLEQWLTDIGVPIKDRLARTYAALKAVPGWIAAKANTLPEVGDLDRRVGQWNAQDWTGGEAARAFGGAIKNTFKDRSKLRALSNYINAGGDKDLLARQAQLTKNPALRKTYEDALTFGEDEEHLAKAIKFYHDQMLEWGRKEGALEEGLDNYLHRYYRSDDPVLQKKLQALEYLKFSKDFAGFKKRYYDSDFEAEQAGLTPEKDAAKRILAYDYGFRQALVAREFVKNSFNAKQAVAKDGRPELDVAGGGTRVEPGEQGGKGVTLIKPKWRQDTGDPKDYRGDYVSFEHPAFKKWKWAATDSDGKPILVQGDILVHPDFAKKYEALFERSWWGKGPVRRALRGGSGFVKQTMLLGPFHLFQITTGGVEHRINPFKLLELNTSDPAQQRMAEAGLFAEAGPYATEGVGGGGLLDKIPVAGQYFQAAKDWLFKDYIPRWKMTLALKAEERNMQRYAPNISKGEVTPEQITRMSARQAAAVFGGQNQRAIFRSKTFQDNLRMLFLAPDFGEERLRQVLQAGGKYGHEQRAALVLGGVAMMVLAKSIEQALTGEMHWKRPFTVTYNGKEYGMRNPASDIGHLISDPVGYLRNRLNPVYTRPLLELMTGRDSFGRKRSAGQQLSDEIKQVIPIPARGLAEKNQSVWESLLNSTGITEHRRSAFGDVMKSINDWKEKKGYNAAAEFVYDSDKDPYYPLTQALSSNDARGAQSQLDKLTAGKSAAERGKVYQHYLKSLVQHRYLTGSRAHEAEFLKEAGAADRQEYDDAKKERTKMWQTFRKAWEKRKQ